LRLQGCVYPGHFLQWSVVRADAELHSHINDTRLSCQQVEMVSGRHAGLVFAGTYRYLITIKKLVSVGFKVVWNKSTIDNFRLPDIFHTLLNKQFFLTFQGH
jgi:hypothetical protein